MVEPVQFSQGQLRKTLGISVETFRHWKRVLPPFAERKKYTPRYSIGDLLAAGVLHRLTEQCGIRAGCLSEISKAVVEICNRNAWAKLEGKALVVDTRQRTCRVVQSARELATQDVVVICPLRPIMDAVRAGLPPQPFVSQQKLFFPPTAIGKMRASRRHA